MKTASPLEGIDIDLIVTDHESNLTFAHNLILSPKFIDSHISPEEALLETVTRIIKTEYKANDL